MSEFDYIFKSPSKLIDEIEEMDKEVDEIVENEVNELIKES